jgi:hypothetical protein
MFLVPSNNSSSFILPEITYADSDSDAAFMRESFAKRHRIACKTLPGRFTHMRTVGGLVSKPSTVTELLQSVFRKG